MSVPDPLGRDRLATGAAMYKKPVYGVKPPPKPFYLRRRFIAIVTAVAVIGSFTIYKLAARSPNTPATAATDVINLFLKQSYGPMRSELCSQDRSQVGTNDLENAGQTETALLKTFVKPQVQSVNDVTLTGGYATVAAKQVTGRITAITGPGTSFKVVTVKEGGRWRVCLSPGGYGLGAFNLDVPLGGDTSGVR